MTAVVNPAVITPAYFKHLSAKKTKIVNITQNDAQKITIDRGNANIESLNDR